ncbi:F-box/kelch-repeat protein At3g06240-like [Papaver somniferum]|uniref:F-box/kelch-repeat protein At3g06240-like n=1 Tax=Papaver somniferum TaxID=3469 RepID=UPI000E6FAAC2|nr:F-box/kelch-repeat protein At3g06240-like [Papaver somniferum]
MNGEVGLMLHHYNEICILSYDPSSSICMVKDQGKFYQDGIDFFGCCHGLVLLRLVDRDRSHIITLWNPATDEYRNLPHPTYEFEDRNDYIEYGFGYDNRLEDYKVVSIASADEDHIEVQVYTLKSNSWRRVENSNLLYCVDQLINRGTPDMSRLPVDGAIYWIAETETKTSPSKDYEVIIYFNIETEQFDEMPFPDLFDESYDTNLCVLGGSLCLLGFNTDIGSAAVWEWKLNGVKKSWTKLFTIDLQKHFGGLLTDLMPLLSLKNGEILFGFDIETGSQIAVYDPKHDTIRILIDVDEGLKGFYPHHASIYVECEVSLDKGTYLRDIMMENPDEERAHNSNYHFQEGNGEENEEEEVEGTGNAKKKIKQI